MTLAIFFSLGLAFVNGGNDNLKGVATLLGSKVLDYRKALWLASISTALGALASVFLAGAGACPRRRAQLASGGPAAVRALVAMMRVCRLWGFPS